VFSCVAAGLSSVAFGFAKTAPQAVFVRFVCGVLNGTIGIVKSYVTQITDETNRPAAFALMPLGFGLGLVAASELGGSLSRPADTWPGVFGAKFWRLFPYALPLLVCGAYQLLTALASHLFLAAVDARSGYAAVDKEVDGEDDKLAPEPAPVVPVWRRRGPVLSCMAYATMAGAQILYDELFPLYARGCLGWRSPKIGTFLACGGSAVFFGAFVAPRCLRACGGRQRFAFSIANSLNLPLGLALPALASWYSLFFLFFATRIVQTVAFTAVMLMVNSSTPVSEVGAVNGLGQSMAASMRAAGPLLGGTIWSGALALARGADHPDATCPRVYTWLPYGARAFLVFAALCACACLPRAAPPPPEPDDEECKEADDPDADAVFELSEKNVEMV